MKKGKNSYHHGHLAESLLDAVDEIASKFGLEAVTLRACAKLVGVSPSSAFRHYADKRALLTAFATRAIQQLTKAMEDAKQPAQQFDEFDEFDEFFAVGMAYIRFALDKPAFFRAMWREETIYSHDEDYMRATQQLGAHLQAGFANTLEDQDPNSFSNEELLAWSAVHGLANLFVEGPVGKGESTQQKLARAEGMLKTLGSAFQ